MRECELVSVMCVIYNHKKYLKDAIEGFLNQKTEYTYHIYLHDDASNDGSGEFVRDMAQKFPDKITAIIQKENLYSKHPEAGAGKNPYIKKYMKGKYLAICEGDDFWLDPNKLQIQVEYMEAHPECAMTAHNAIIYDENSKSMKAMSPYDKEQDISIEETIMWYRGNIPTASTVLRTEAYFREGIFNNCCPSGDWMTQLYCLTQGKIHYFDRIMSCYRANVVGSYTTTKWADIKKRVSIRVSQIIFLISYDRYMKRKYHEIVIRKINQSIECLLKEIEDLSDEEVGDIFAGIDYFHVGMTYEQHEQYKKFILSLRDIALRHKDNHFCPQKIRSMIAKSKNVYIYGAGYYGKKMLRRLSSLGIEVCGFIVSSGQSHEDRIEGVQIYELCEIAEELDNSLVILGVSVNIRDEIKKNLEGIQNVNVAEEEYDFEF